MPLPCRSHNIYSTEQHTRSNRCFFASTSMTILSLSNELLISIFIASPTVHDALRLSGTSRLFRAIFLEYETLIMEGILRPQIFGFEDAPALAIAETSFLDIKGPTGLSPDGPQLPLRFCIPRLLRNAELASSACAECAAHPEPDVDPYERGQKHLTPLPDSYYFIRLMVLAYDFRQLRGPLYTRLRTAPAEWIHHRDKLITFLIYVSKITCQHRHCIHSNPSWGTAEEVKEYARSMELFIYHNWEYANDIIADANTDCERPGNELEKTIRAYSR